MTTPVLIHVCTILSRASAHGGLPRTIWYIRRRSLNGQAPTTDAKWAPKIEDGQWAVAWRRCLNGSTIPVQAPNLCEGCGGAWSASEWSQLPTWTQWTNFQCITQEFSTVGGNTEDLQKPQNWRVGTFKMPGQYGKGLVGNTPLHMACKFTSSLYLRTWNSRRDTHLPFNRR